MHLAATHIVAEVKFRRHFGKLTSLSLFNTLHHTGAFDPTHMPPPSLTLDTSLAAPESTANVIAQHLYAISQIAQPR